MKLMLHFLKFDLLRWKWLVAAQWALVPVYVWLVHLFSKVDYAHRKPGSVSLDTVLICAWCVFGLLTLCGCSLSLFGGMDRSRLRDRPLHSGRPLKFMPSICGRILLILAGAALPSFLAHVGALAVLGFSPATILHAAGTISVVCAGSFICLTLWGYIWPRLPYIILGLLIAGFIWTKWQSSQSHLPRYRQSQEIPPAEWILASCWLCALAALVVGRFQGRVTGAVKGLFLGAGFTSLCFGHVAIRGAWLRWNAPSLETFLADAETKEVRASKPICPHDIRDTPAAVEAEAFTFLLHSPIPTHPADDSRGSVIGVSWRRDDVSQWSPWLPTLRGDSPVHEGSGHLVVPTGSMDEFIRGNLRLAMMIPVPGTETTDVPLIEGRSVSGRNWSARVLGASRHSSSCFRWRGMLANLSGTGQEGDYELGLIDKTYFNKSGQGSFGRLPFVDLQLRSQEVEWLASEQPPDQLQVRHRQPLRARGLILELNGVTIDRSRADPDGKGSRSPGPEDYAQWRVGSRLLGIRPARPFPDKVPTTGAPESELAEYLHWLMCRQDLGITDEGAAQDLAAHVPDHLPIFIEALRFGGHNHTILQALAWGIPEERRMELIGQITDMPVLIEVAQLRGWMAEAKPYFQRLVEQTGLIVTDYLGVAMRYKEPAFNKAMRRNFRFDPEFIRYWEEMPGLSEDLPALLERNRTSLLDTNRPFDYSTHALLLTGEPGALNCLLNTRRDSSTLSALILPEANRVLCGADGRRAPEHHAGFLDFIGKTTAADYWFDSARRCWMQKETTP